MASCASAAARYLIDDEPAMEALYLCAPSVRVNFADAMLWATTRCSGDAGVWTFDRSFPSDGVRRLDP